MNVCRKCPNFRSLAWFSYRRPHNAIWSCVVRDRIRKQRQNYSLCILDLITHASIRLTLNVRSIFCAFHYFSPFYSITFYRSVVLLSVPAKPFIFQFRRVCDILYFASAYQERLSHSSRFCVMPNAHILAPTPTRVASTQMYRWTPMIRGTNSFSHDSAYFYS